MTASHFTYEAYNFGVKCIVTALSSEVATGGILWEKLFLEIPQNLK